VSEASAAVALARAADVATRPSALRRLLRRPSSVVATAIVGAFIVVAVGAPRFAPLDPIATRRIEELMIELSERFTIAIVTHNLQQAQRVADRTGFLYVDTTEGGRTGYLVEFGDSRQIFEDPQHPHTQQYIRGEFS